MNIHKGGFMKSFFLVFPVLIFLLSCSAEVSDHSSGESSPKIDPELIVTDSTRSMLSTGCAMGCFQDNISSDLTARCILERCGRELGREIADRVVSKVNRVISEVGRIVDSIDFENLPTGSAYIHSVCDGIDMKVLQARNGKCFINQARQGLNENLDGVFWKPENMCSIDKVYKIADHQFSIFACIFGHQLHLSGLSIAHENIGIPGFLVNQCEFNTAGNGGNESCENNGGISDCPNNCGGSGLLRDFIRDDDESPKGFEAPQGSFPEHGLRCPRGNGTYCGNANGGNRNGLYSCEDGFRTFIKQCTYGCATNVFNPADHCRVINTCRVRDQIPEETEITLRHSSRINVYGPHEMTVEYRLSGGHVDADEVEWVTTDQDGNVIDSPFYVRDRWISPSVITSSALPDYCVEQGCNIRFGFLAFPPPEGFHFFRIRPSVNGEIIDACETSWFVSTPDREIDILGWDFDRDRSTGRPRPVRNDADAVKLLSNGTLFYRVHIPEHNVQLPGDDQGRHLPLDYKLTISLKNAGGSYSGKFMNLTISMDDDVLFTPRYPLNGKEHNFEGRIQDLSPGDHWLSIHWRGPSDFRINDDGNEEDINFIIQYIQVDEIT